MCKLSYGLYYVRVGNPRALASGLSPVHMHNHTIKLPYCTACMCILCIVTPNKRSDAQPLVEREKQFECRLVEISRSYKGKEMLHVLYIIINISCPRKRIKNRGMSCNLLRVPTFMV